MAIYTGVSRITEAKKKAAKSIAKQQRAAQKKEGKRGFWSGLAGKGLGAIGGSAIAGALGVASGGLLMPLIMGASASMAKKWTDEASQKLVKAGKIEATGPYGYGKEAAKEARKDIKESRKSTWSPESLGQDIALSYVSAGMKGELGGAKQLLKGDLTGKEALLGTTTDKFGKAIAGTGTKGIEGAKAGVGELFGTAWGEGEDEATMLPTQTSQAQTPLTTEELGESAFAPGGEGAMESFDPTINPELDEEGWSITGEQGGQVPTQQQLLAMLALSQMQQQEKTYDNTPLEEVKPTISDYFASKGKTLGGNNMQSLSQMLGR